MNEKFVENNTEETPEERLARERLDRELKEIDDHIDAERKSNPLRHVISDINQYWQIVNDVDALPLDIDPAAKIGKKLLEGNKSEYARILFDAVKDSEGEKKMNYATVLDRLLMCLNTDSKAQVLKELMTTHESVKNTINEEWKKIKSKQSMIGKFKMEIEKLLNKLRGSSDEV